MITKVCKYCNKEKDIVEFPKNGKYTRNKCNSCVLEYKQNWNKDNHDYQKDYNKQYRIDNRDEIIVNKKQDYQDNKEQYLEHKKKYYNDNTNKCVIRN